MKVCIVSDVLGEPNNGTSLAAYNLINYLKSKGHEVRILCGDADKKGKPGFYVVNNLNLGKSLNKYLKKNGVLLAKPDKEVIKAALDGVDICHSILPFVLGRATLKNCKKEGIPITSGFHCQAENFTAHVFLMDSHLANHLTYENFYKHYYKKVDAIHYPTQFIRDVFEREIGHKTNGYVISNGVNDIFKKQQIKRDDKFINILSSGRYSKEKDQETILKAIALSKYKDKIHLTLAGKGPNFKNLVELQNELGLKNIDYKFCTREELVKIINTSDLYIHAAIVEIEAISCLESIRCGVVPVIADSPRSATKYFALDDRNLFKFKDPEDLKNKIEYWIEHKKEKEECSKKYLHYTDQFDQTYCMEQMEKMLKEVIKNHEK